MLDGNTAALNQYMDAQDRAEERANATRESRIGLAWAKVSMNADLVTEAIGPDGHKGTLLDWNRLAIEIGEAIEMNDEAELGRIIMAYARPYLQERVEEEAEAML